MVSQIQSQVNIQAYEIERGFEYIRGGLKTKKSLRPGWLCTNQEKKGEKKDYISQKDYFSNTCGTPNNIYLYQSTWHITRFTPKDSNLVVLVANW